MTGNNIRGIIEAMLFSIGREMSAIEISSYIEVDVNKIEEILDTIKNEYSEKSSGIQIIRIKDAYQMVSNKEYYDYVVKLFDNNKRANISNAAMEVLSIIAYNSDVTRAEIEKIRGVNSDGAVNRLMEYNLVEESGRLDLPGRPATYKITDDFYRVFGINDLSELPELPVFEAQNQTKVEENKCGTLEEK